MKIRLSPPLMPTTPPYSPGEPALEAMQIEMTSTPEDLIAKDAAIVEKQVLEDSDSVQVPASDGPALSGEATTAAIEKYIAVPSSSSPRPPKRLRDLEVEPPLTPQHHPVTSPENGSSAGKYKKLRFDPDLATLFPELEQEVVDDSFDFDDQEGAAALQDALQARTLSVEKEIREEELVEVDTTMRVKVPLVEYVPVRLPWEIFISNSSGGANKKLQRNFLATIKRDLLSDQRKWAGIPNVEQSLPWAPFNPYLAKVDLNEEFDDGSLARYLGEMKLEDYADEIDVESLTAIEDRMRFLRGIEDEEEIEAVEMDDDDVLDQPREGHPTHQQPDEQVTSNEKPETPSCAPNKQQAQMQNDHTRALKAENPALVKAGLASASSTFLHADGLDTFMKLQGTNSGASGEPIRKRESSHRAPKGPSVPSAAPAAVMVPQAKPAANLPNSSLSIPVPATRTGITETVPIVASLEFLSKRQLIRDLEVALSTIELIERDAVALAGPGRGQGTPDEADLTISPSTGIIMTTLQKIKQKALPGQKQFRGVKDRITSAAPRYERLIVLISEGSFNSLEDEAAVRPLDQLDSEALADLMGWALSLDSDVEITYIPGSKNCLASWLAALISHRGITDGSLPLLQDETMWERWLRKAGMNPFAAQAVLYQLKPPESDSEETSSVVEAGAQRVFGLAAFFMMNSRERVRRFAPILGGERVLLKVSDLIDRPWTGKVNGEQHDY